MYRKALVYSIWTLETLHLVLVTQDIYRIFINGFGLYTVANDLHLLPLTIGIMGGLSMYIPHKLLNLNNCRPYAPSWAHMSSYVGISCPPDIAVTSYRGVNCISACSAAVLLNYFCSCLTDLPVFKYAYSCL